MAFSCSSFSGCRLRSNIPYFSRLRVQLPPQARSQSFGHEGNSSNTVDAEMSVLRYRIEQVRMKERSNTRSNLIHGWNYRPGYDVVNKKPSMLLTSIQLASIVGRTVGLVFFSGSLCIFLVSLIFHHGQIK